MKAAIYEEYGSPEVLQLRDVPEPSPADGEVLIRVHAAEATKSDCELRRGKFPVKWFWLPLRIVLGLRKPRRQIPGCYFAGRIEAVGKAVTGHRVGAAVFGCAGLRMGSYGELMCLPGSNTIVSMPDNMGFTDASAVPLGGLNALHFMRRARIQVGDAVLINGAGGSIGSFGVQIAKDMGAEVTAVDAPHKEAALRRLGADHFIDYTKQDFSDCRESYDVVFDMVAGSSYARSIKALRPGGRYVMGNPRLSDMLRSVFTSLFTDKSGIFAFAAEKPEELQTLKTMIEAGRINSIVGQVLPLERVAEAHRLVESEQRVGAVVIELRR